MLQTFLFVAVPALITLTAALYFLNRISREGPETYQHFSSGPGSWNLTQNSTSQAAGGDTVAKRRTKSSDTPKSHTGECVVCYEESNIVELYPCRHRSLCEDCVLKIISRNTRVCPLCRRKIQGYSEVF
uniref:RING-type domain-containing protein n=1 Tax=Arion vulgaris TaxID=1028688 RepID=A0A0B6ZR64_9EUPU